MSKYIIIEDDPYYVEILEAIVENEGDSYITFEDAYEAFKEIGKINDYDGVILDLMMPKDGILIKKAPNHISAGEIIFDEIRNLNRSIPIVVITAKDAYSLPTNMKEDGNTFIITKPTDPDDIENMEQFLGRYK